MKKNKGITLIALVITIVILLILAAVSINAILGENGILKRAQSAKAEEKIGKEKEEILLAYNNLKSSKIINGVEIDEHNLKEELEKNGNNIESVELEEPEFIIAFGDTKNKHTLNYETGEIILSQAGGGSEEGGGSSSGSSSTIPYVASNFEIYDTSGNKLSGFDNLFDKDLSTGVSRNDSQILVIKWNGNLTGKLLYIKTNFSYADSRYIRYYDSNGNVLNAYKSDGTLTQNANWNGYDSITFIPENASELQIRVNAGYPTDTIYEIQLFDEGKYTDSLITNFSASNIKSYGLDLSWSKGDSVTKTRIYKDGVFLAEVDGTTYTVDSGLISNSDYVFSLEPITNSTTENYKNSKQSINVKTAGEEVEFYVDGYSGFSRRYYKEFFDKDLSTGIGRNNSTPLIFKWNGDANGKQLLIKTNFDVADSRTFVYLDSNNQPISFTTSNGTQTTRANWNGYETITTIPDNAVAIQVRINAGYSNDTLYEIQVVEDGWFNTKNLIKNAKAEDVTQYSLKLKWKKDNSVTSTKIYQDGILLDETTDTEYVVDRNLVANTDYVYTLEPITSNVTASRKNKQVTIKAKTQSEDVEFYIDGFNGNSRKYYKEYFDNDISTGIGRNNSDRLTIKWNGNAAGKKLMVKTNFSAGSDRMLKFKDSNGNYLNVTTEDNTTTEYINFNNGESVVYVPNDAVLIDLFMCAGYPSFTVYNISIIE